MNTKQSTDRRNLCQTSAPYYFEKYSQFLFCIRKYSISNMFYKSMNEMRLSKMMKTILAHLIPRCVTNDIEISLKGIDQTSTDCPYNLQLFLSIHFFFEGNL